MYCSFFFISPPCFLLVPAVVSVWCFPLGDGLLSHVMACDNSLNCFDFLCESFLSGRGIYLCSTAYHHEVRDGDEESGISKTWGGWMSSQLGFGYKDYYYYCM